MKRLLLTLSVIAASCVANAAYLYWQLDDEGYEGQYDSVKITGNNGPVTIYGSVWNDKLGDYEIGVIAANDVEAGTTYLIDAGDIDSGYSYYIELLNSESEVVNNTSTPISGSKFTQYAAGNTTSDLTNLAGGEIAVWHASSGGMDVVPEPTSAILMLFGAAMLGLKRKQRRLA